MPDLDPAAVEAGNGCGAVHEQAKAVCTRPAGHDGSHANRHGYWLPREGERHTSIAVDPEPVRSPCLSHLEAELAEARASLERMREREAHFARVLSVADGGQYRNDWDAAIESLMARAERAEADLAMCREALEWMLRATDPLPPDGIDAHLAAREALSRLDHSSEEGR